MICRVEGVIDGLGPMCIYLKNGALTYEIWVPQSIMSRSNVKLHEGAQISLEIFHYIQSDPSRSIPMLIGFTNKLEKEFFEKFITVSGVGPKAALKALNKPISEIASAIDAADVKFMKSLPGIGEQRAKEIVAKLQGKMSRFGLIPSDTQSGDLKESAFDVQHDVKREALDILLQLQYRKDEALQMIDRACQARGKSFDDAQQLLNEVYLSKKKL